MADGNVRTKCIYNKTHINNVSTYRVMNRDAGRWVGVGLVGRYFLGRGLTCTYNYIDFQVIWDTVKLFLNYLQ